MKKFVSLALALLMVAVLLPVTAMADTSEVRVSTADIENGIIKTIGGMQNDVTYVFAPGNYGTIAIYLEARSNITFKAEAGATFTRLEIGYHNGVPVETKTNSTLTVEGVTVEGQLFINSADQKVVVKGNTAGSIAIKTHHFDDMDIEVLNNTITGVPNASSNDTDRYGIYIVPNKTNYDLTITGNQISNVADHAIAIQGCGDGTAVTAAKTITVTDNTFNSYGVNNKSNRAAFKIWDDTTYAPTDAQEATEAALALAASISQGNTFGRNLGENCVAALFNNAPVALPEQEPTVPGTITIIVPSAEETPKPAEDQKNPSTGANDFVGVAAAAALVALLGSAAVLRKK